MLSDEEGWLLHGLEAVERVIERGIVRKQFLEAIRVMKLEYYGRAKQGRRSWGGLGGRVPPSFLSGGDEYLIIPPTF